MAFRDMELYDPEGPVPDPPAPPAGEERRRWPLVAVIGLVLLLVAGVAWRVHGTHSQVTSTNAPAPAAAGSASSTSSEPTTVQAPADTSSSTPQAGAVAFVTAWAHPDRAVQQWQAAVRPYATSAFATRLLSVDPGNVPATKVTGPAGPAKVTGQTAAVDVPTDAGAVTVTLQQVGQEWRVSGITPARASEEE